MTGGIRPEPGQSVLEMLQNYLGALNAPFEDGEFVRTGQRIEPVRTHDRRHPRLRGDPRRRVEDGVETGQGRLGESMSWHGASVAEPDSFMREMHSPTGLSTDSKPRLEAATIDRSGQPGGAP